MATTISKVWAAATIIMNAVSVTTGSNSDIVDLETDGYEGTHVTIDADFPAGPTDDLEIEVQASIDGAGFDDTPFDGFTIDKDTDPNQVSIIIRDVAQFRIFAKRSGSTDTITVTIKSRPWRWQSV